VSPTAKGVKSKQYQLAGELSVTNEPTNVFISIGSVGVKKRDTDKYTVIFSR
jgi:hypothetical protein